MADTDLLGLIERVEKLEGPDREVDALIWCAIHKKRYMGHNQAYGSNETQVEFTEPPKRRRMVSGAYGMPHAMQWTGSLDAAMTLVPEGWLTDRATQDFDGAEWHWSLYPAFKHADRVWGQAGAAAIALTAAALRARLSIGDV